MRVFYKLKWHDDADSSAGRFVEWAAKRDLLGDEIAPEQARDVKRGRLSGRRLLELYDGSFTSDMVLPEVEGFAAWCFAADGAVPATAHALDAAYAKWRATSTEERPNPAPSSALAARLARLRARAKQPHAVAVEHLTAFVQLGDAAAAAPLRALAATHGWPRHGRRVVPLGAWTDAIALLLEAGPQALAAAAIARQVEPAIAVGALEAMHTLPAALGLLELATWAEQRKDVPLRGEAIEALGAVLGHEGVVLGVAPARRARDLAHRVLAKKASPLEQLRCYRLLEHVGDAASLALIAGRAPLEDEWQGCEKPVLRALAARLSRRPP